MTDIRLTVEGMMHRIAFWTVTRLGEACLTDRHERAVRLVEEAIELCQAEGVTQEFVQRVLDRAYSRPVGDVEQEGGGVGLTFLAWAFAAKLDPMKITQCELERIEAKPLDFYRRKQEEKARAGTARPPEKP